MTKKLKIEILTRAVIVEDGHLLVCRSNGAGNVYLPGGHVEPGEQAARALERELAEELGRESQVTRFLGAVEHAFVQHERQKYEINLVFGCTVAGLSAARIPHACEPHLSFQWVKWNGLRSVRLEPAALVEALQAWWTARPATDHWRSCGQGWRSVGRIEH